MSISASILERGTALWMNGLERAAPSAASWLHAIDDVGKVGAGARPIVIQGGLSSNSYQYEALARVLESKGFSVYVNQLPWHGWASAKDDAAALVKTVDRALIDSGADKVTLIGHSKGGLSARWYLQRLGGVEHVAQLLTLGSPHNGVSPLGHGLVARLAAELPTPGSVKELMHGSPLVRELADDLPRFMQDARRIDPAFRIVSIAGDMHGIGGDMLVSVRASRVEEVASEIRNIVLRSGPRNHFDIAAQGRVNADAMRHLVEHAAQSRLPASIKGAATGRAALRAS